MPPANGSAREQFRFHLALTDFSYSLVRPTVNGGAAPQH